MFLSGWIHEHHEHLVPTRTHLLMFLSENFDTVMDLYGKQVLERITVQEMRQRLMRTVQVLEGGMGTQLRGSSGCCPGFGVFVLTALRVRLGF